MKMFKKMGALLIAVCLTASSVPFFGVNAFGATLAYGGWYNSAYAEWEDADAKKATVEYKLTGDSKYTKIEGDDIALIRQYGSKARVDIPGLKAGTYDLRITPSDGSAAMETKVKIYDEDRSGYAHFGATEGVGAYNNDGTPKANADIIYVTNETKNTVKYGSYTGIANILCHMQTGAKPLIVRFIGTVDTTAWEVDASASTVNSPKVGKSTYVINETKGKPAGSAAYLYNFKDGKSETNTYVDTTNSGIRISGLNTKFTGYTGNSFKIIPLKNDGTDETGAAESFTVSGSEQKGSCFKINAQTTNAENEDTNLNTMDVKNGAGKASTFSNVTIEGIGTDAVAKNWGFTIQNGQNVEVKNITFNAYHEDACTFSEGSTRGWLHRCTFNPGANRCDLTWEKDKSEGDGSSDMNQCHYMTVSYNIYNKCHKTSLNGGSDSTVQTNYTYHHNYYNDCSQRLPLTRHVNLHVYNNYTYSADVAISARASAWVFSENNYYDECRKPFEVVSGSNAIIKSCGDIINQNAPSDSNIHLNAGRTETFTVSGNAQSERMQNFDTHSDVFYYDEENMKTDVTYLTDANQAKTDAQNSGVMTNNPTIIEFEDEAQEEVEEVTETVTVQEAELVTEGTTTETETGTITYEPDGKGGYDINDTSGYTARVIYNFDKQTKDKVIISGTFTTYSNNSSWNLLQVFGTKIGSDTDQVFGIRVGGGSADPTYRQFLLNINNEQIKIGNTISDSQHTYPYTFTIDFSNKTVKLVLDGYTCSADLGDVTSVSSVQFITAASSSRRIAVTKPEVKVIKPAPTGDANGDGAVTDADAVLVARQAENMENISDENNKYNADFVHDETIDNQDAKAIADYVAKNAGVKAA